MSNLKSILIGYLQEEIVIHRLMKSFHDKLEAILFLM